MFLRLTDIRCISKGALGGSNRKLSSTKRPGRPIGVSHHFVLTLDPNKFAEKKQPRLHIGHLQTFNPHVQVQKTFRAVPRGLAYDNTKLEGKQIRHHYPPDTKAFLYYFRSRERPRIAGELRLRVASSDDPASFESGSDLLRIDGRPWSRPLFVLPKHAAPLYQKLREDQLIPDDLHTAISNLPPIIPSYRRSQMIYAFSDTFIVDFTKETLFFIVITEKGFELSTIQNPIVDFRRSSNGSPYTGSVLARFERSTLPQHKGTKTVVLRCLKIMTPVECVIPSYDGYISCPMEGELFHRGTFGRACISGKPWSVDIDKLKHRNGMRKGFQLLWDS